MTYVAATQEEIVAGIEAGETIILLAAGEWPKLVLRDLKPESKVLLRGVHNEETKALETILTDGFDIRDSSNLILSHVYWTFDANQYDFDHVVGLIQNCTECTLTQSWGQVTTADLAELPGKNPGPFPNVNLGIGFQLKNCISCHAIDVVTTGFFTGFSINGCNYCDAYQVWSWGGTNDASRFVDNQYSGLTKCVFGAPVERYDHGLHNDQTHWWNKDVPDGRAMHGCYIRDCWFLKDHRSGASMASTSASWAGVRRTRSVTFGNGCGLLSTACATSATSSAPDLLTSRSLRPRSLPSAATERGL